MPDPVVFERLELILLHAQKIELRLQGIPSADYFISSEAGEQLYDSLLARLQAMGENFKKIDQLDALFIPDQLKIDITPVIRFRDLISHHYDLLDYQVIYRICKVEIPIVIAAVQKCLLQGQ